MILSLYQGDKTLRIEISIDDFMLLRQRGITPELISEISGRYQLPDTILLDYVNDLNSQTHETAELDSACDYTDHFA